MKSQWPRCGIPLRVAGHLRSYCLPLIAAVAIATTLARYVMEVPGHYRGGWHHHYYN
jgi:hypothetical protein